MTGSRKRWRAAACVLAAAFALPAAAQTYPTQSIRLIVPYGPGQATDVMCRVFAEQLKVVLKQNIVIENRVGAASNLGSAEAAKAAPDGYTLLCTGSATHVANPLLYSSMGFDPDKDLVPITGIAATGYVLAAGPKLRDKSLKEVVALAKTSQPPLKMGLASTTARVVFEMFRQAASVSTMTNVPYMAGNRDLFPDLLRGDTDLVIEAMPSAMGSLTGGQVAAVAVTLPERSPLLPKVPTFKENGFDLQLVGWNALYAPRGTSPEIVARLNAAGREALKHPEVAKRLEAVACVPMPTSPEQLSKMIAEDRAKWKPIVEEYKLKAN
ncbi:MAG: MFS transporter [Betaproteobacteria bacterium]|nr:MAG: MFS transporter [Betaproteobacteria bacterium]